jgi:hypothetical protein
MSHLLQQAGVGLTIEDFQLDWLQKMESIERSESGKLDVHRAVFSVRMLVSRDAVVFEIKNGGRKRSSLDFIVGQAKRPGRLESVFVERSSLLERWKLQAGR